MPVNEFNPVPHGRRAQIRISELERMADATEAQSRLRGDSSRLGSLTINSGPAGVLITQRLPIEFWARITGRTGLTYAYHAQLDSPGVVWTNEESGLESEAVVDQLPAYEVNGSTDVPTGTIVRMYRGTGEYFLFSHCCENAMIQSLLFQTIPGFGSPVQTQGVHGLLAFWVGGAASP